jgi:hypothetical protein
MRRTRPSTAIGAPAVSLYCAERGGEEIHPGLFQYQSEIHLDAASMTAGLSIVRSVADQPGLAIGDYEMRIDGATLSEGIKAIHSADFDNVKVDEDSANGSDTLSYVVCLSGQPVERLINSEDARALAQLGPFNDFLEELESELLESPKAALSVAVEQQGSAYILVLKNIGSAPILVADPRRDSECRIQVAPIPVSIPGYTDRPLQWTYIELEAASGTEEFEFQLAPAEERRFVSQRWESDAAKAPHIAQGIYSSYPAVAQENGILRIRGMAFSEGLTVDSD